MFIVGRQAVGESFNPTGDQALLDNYYGWALNWYHKSGGRKKNLFFGMDGNPVSEISFEKNKKICGSGKVKLAFLNFPVDADDYIEMYYDDTLMYRALVDNSIDPKGGDVKLVPYSQRFSELLHNENFTSQTIESIIESLIEDNQTDTGIGYNAANIDTGESGTYSYNFNYKNIKSCIDQVTEKLDSRWWGVNPSNSFVIYANNSTDDYILTDETEKGFSSVERKYNFERIKETRREVFKKDTAGDKQRIGQVGYGGSYPTLSIETVSRKKVKTYDISESNLSSGDALDVAYEDLKKTATLGETIKIKEIDITKYNLDIGDRVTVIDGYEKVLETIIDCDSVTSWTGATLDTTDYIEGTGSVQGEGYNAANSIITYDFGEIKRFNYPEFYQFMVTAEDTGNILEYSFSNNSSTLWTTSHDLFIDTANVWQIVTCNCSSETTFQYFAVRLKSALTLSQRYFNNVGSMRLSESFQDTPTQSTFNIDRVQVYHYAKNEYTGNVVQINYKIDKFGTHIDAILNDYDEQSLGEITDIDVRLEKVDTIQKQ